MSVSEKSVSLRFGWPKFVAVVAVITTAAAIVEAFSYASWRQWRFANNAAVLMVIWVLLFLAYRWHLLRQQELNGSFVVAQYLINPRGYFAGPLRPRIQWFGLG